MGFTVVFSIFLVVFAILLMAAGWYTRRWINDASDFLLAGREVSLLINTFGVAAIGFAGTSITLVPGLTIQGGYTASLAFSLIYLFGGLALYGWVFAPIIRRSGAQTLPEWLEMRYDKNVRTIITVCTILGLVGILANNVVSMAVVVSGFTGWPEHLVTSILFLAFIVFVYAGGFWGVTLTDFIQMIIGLIALPTFLIVLAVKYGWIGTALSNWPGPGSPWTTGIGGWQIPVWSLKYPSVLSMVLLYAAFLVWGNNYYWLRISSCRSERAARMSYVYASLILFFFLYVVLQFIGFYAAAAYPGEFQPIGKTSPMAAYGVAMRSVPVLVSSFSLIGALAASLSTAATAQIGATSTAVRDIYQRIIKPNATPKELVWPSRWITVILALIVWALCFYPGGPLYLFAFANAWLGPPSVLVLLGVFWKRTTRSAALWGGLGGILTMVVLTVLDLTKIWSINPIMHPGVAGLLVTLALVVVISLATEPKYYGASGWMTNPEKVDVEKRVKLTAREEEVLELIAQGYNTMAEVSDMLGVDSSVSNGIVEKLDQERLIVRGGGSGAGFYTFSLTELGRHHLAGLGAVNARLAELGLSELDVSFLRAVAEGEVRIRALVAEKKLGSLQVAAVVSKLVRQGRLRELGLWRRSLKLSEAGKETLGTVESLLGNVG